jgi:ketosteroid isomerase-like protein
MKHMFLAFTLAVALPSFAFANSDEDAVRKALDAYDQAVAKKDVDAVRAMLAPEILLYEHSVRNDGAKDAFENHLKPEILEGDGLQLSFYDLRVTASPGLALITRQYRVQGKFEGKAVDSKGNETHVWEQKDGRWKIIHIHYSHACPKTKAAS